MAGVDSAGSSLIQAVTDGDLLVTVNRLIEGGANVNAVNENDQTALMIVAKNSSFIPGMAISLMNGGADVNIKDIKGNTALMYAIAYANENTALAIMESSKDLDLNTVDNQGQTALMKAAIFGMTTIADALVNRGADVSIKDKEGQTALMYAIAYPNENIALAIMENSKLQDLNTVDNQGQTALMKAAYGGTTTIADALITRGADVNKTDKKGRVALMYIGLADSDNDFGFYAGILTHKLINAGADVTKTDEEGNTALMYNVKYEKSVKELIERGKASVDVRNDQGRTALFYALVESILSARYLVENGANLHLIDNCNVSVLSYFIHHCINNGVPDETSMHEKLALLKGIKEETMQKTVIDAVFCKFPLFKNRVNSISAKSILSFLFYVVDLSRKRFTSDDDKDRVFQELASLIARDEYFETVPDLLKVLGNLLKHGADPNTADEQGNTIAHHITLLGMYGNTVEAKSAFDALLWLVKKGLRINQANYNGETPLPFMLAKAVNQDEIGINLKAVIVLCNLFLEKDPVMGKGSSQSGDSIFHLLIKLSNMGDINEESFEGCIVELLQRCSHPRIVNGTNDDMNTPLHVWAAGSQPKLREGVDCQGPSEKILDQLLSCGAVHHARNLKAETPLHMCRTWTAVKLLFKAGAKTNDVDSLGRSPLLSAAKNCLFLNNPGCFYPDVSPDEAPTFFETVLDMGFDLWTCDKNGDSIISILIKENSFELANSLIEITCNNSRNLQDETLVGVLNAICKDELTQTTWKVILVDKLLKKLTRRSLKLSLPLRSCCMNIIDNYETIRHAEAAELDSVHYEIAKQLLRYGASGESCLYVAEGCPPLQTLLSTPVSMEGKPLLIRWTSCSQKHKNKLAEVARGLNCNFQEPYWYHNKEIGCGAFGQVFVGIHENDGMEVAVKRVHYIQQDREEDIREIRTFASLKCEHVVCYITFLKKADYSFVVMELMEGNLIEYFTSNVYDVPRQTKVLCRDVALGLKYLHEQNIIHRDLKPTNILYKTNPQLCLKIADFGLSRRIDVNATFTVMATRVGTRNWIAPEVMKSTTYEHSTSSDVFSCGLVFHYILSIDHRHPFSPVDCTAKSEIEIIAKTEINILNDNIEGWDSYLDPEASHVITGMLNCMNEKERPTASMLLYHPMFWSKKKKLDFLIAVGKQKEFECPRAKRPAPSLRSDVEQDLENVFTTIVKFGKWDDSRYKQTSEILNEIKKPIVKHDKKGKRYNVPARKYDIGSAVELVRFIRNAIAHVSEASLPPVIRTQILQDAVFLEEFPNLVIEVFKAVTAHGWDVSREEIKYVLSSDNPNRESLGGIPPDEDLDEPLVIRCWEPNSKEYKEILRDVATRQTHCKFQGPYRYCSEPIAEGSFGHVFVGIHKKDGREVAIKRVSNLKLNRKRDSPRSREVMTLSSLSSLPVCEHIVRYIDCITKEDFSFIIMELMEGNLIECFANDCFDQREIKLKLCRDVALGLKYLHEQEIIHRDLKPINILYKTYPELCLKIADFGLSHRVDINASFTVMTTGVGTRGWIAPEVIKSTTQDHSMSSDVFSLGLIFHYILSNKKHPFSPADCTGKSDHEINIATQGNILKNDMEGWSKSVDPESSGLIKGMLNCTNEKERPTASMLLHHPMFWSKKKKLDFLSAVGNQKEFECPRAIRTAPLTMVEQDLEKEVATIVKFGMWDDPRYTQTSVIFIEMQKPIVKHDKKGKPYNVPARKYDIGSAVELVRFIRNAIAHVSEASRPTVIRTLILEDAVFLDEFPNLVIEVFKAVTAHGWHVSREEIKHVLAND